VIRSEHARLDRVMAAPPRLARIVRAAAVVLVLLLASACNAEKEVSKYENVRPPQPGTPASAADVQGIYRTSHQGLLQLRGNGQFVLIVPEGPGPSGGTFTLQDGTLTVRTNVCGTAVGQYHVAVSGPPEAGKATLTFTPISDDCGPRQHYLTIDPWVYANS
jgi:hypothetical protein